MVLNQLGQIAEAMNADAAWDIATRHLAAMGFGRLTYGLTQFRFENSNGTPEDALHLTTAATPGMIAYFTEGRFAQTPVFRWIMENTGSCTWRWVDDARIAGTLSAAELAALAVNDSLDINAGIAFSFPETSHRIKGAFGMFADPGMDHDDVDAVWSDRGAEITALAHMMHLKIATLPRQSPRRTLTARQREALEWVADGKTTQDIAILMGISTAMIEKHLRLARDALDVETTAQAVAKGTLLKMIFTRNQDS